MKFRKLWLAYPIASVMLAVVATVAYFGDAVINNRVAIDGVGSRSVLWYAAGVVFVIFWTFSWLPFSLGPWLFGHHVGRRSSRRDS